MRGERGLGSFCVFTTRSDLLMSNMITCVISNSLLYELLNKISREPQLQLAERSRAVLHVLNYSIYSVTSSVSKLHIFVSTVTWPRVVVRDY